MNPSKEIDRARVGLSKSLMASPCERKGAYGEWVRDEQGRRLDFPMPERVTFGTAVDEAVAFILWHELHDSQYQPADAVAAGIAAASKKLGWSLIEDVTTFRVQLANAVDLYLKPHLQPSGVLSNNGLARILAFADEGIHLQGIDGESLRAAPDLIGTPDIVTSKRVIDVKTSGRAYNEQKFYTSPEMPVYSLLFTEQFGYLPDWLGYQVYVRVTKPYWQFIQAPASVAHIDLARLHAERWRKGLATKDITLFAFDTAFCGDCPFANPIPEANFEGCPVGLAVNAQEVAA